MEKSEAFIILKGITRASRLEDAEKEELINIIGEVENKKLSGETIVMEVK